MSTIPCPVTTDLEGTLTLNKEALSCTVVVDNIHVVVTRTDEGVVVDLLDPEKLEVLASTYAYNTEAEDHE